jgi:hypothetical protein
MASSQLVAGATLEREGVTYRAIPELGAWFGLEQTGPNDVYPFGKVWLYQVPADAETGAPVWASECDVTNVDDRQDVVDQINAVMGTSFTLDSFAGR